ncbi:universal stress protein [Halobaculum sp. MBLA0143]|uniref:universal stress protein n=1 Tax=Halobaculum sp. MBLA0143 TaxID=3079933 RepID=UPI0035255167
MEYERILLPVAGDGDVDPVVDHARSLAVALDAELLALHVVDPDDDGGTAAPGETGTVTEPRGADAVFEAVADHVDDAVPLERVTVTGDPGDAIVETVRDQDCDFVVMGTHNRQGLDRLVTGSVADHVGQAAAVPVTTIHVDD